MGWERRGGTIVVDAVVPPNTTATVRLPGAAEPLSVGSGSHRWEVAAPASGNGRGPVSLDTPLAEVIDDREAFDALMAALRAQDEAKAREFCDQTRWLPHLSLGHALARVPGEISDDVRAALESVSRGRAG